jgi:chaperonin cofactor prefoldin
MPEINGVILTGIYVDFDELLGNYESDISLFYKHKSKANELLNTFKNFSEEEKKYAMFEMKKISQDEKFDYFKTIIFIMALNEFGKVNEVKDQYKKLVNYLIKIKKFHRVLEVNEYLEMYGIKLKEIHRFQKVVTLRVGNVDNIGSDKEVLDYLDFNDVKMNSSVFSKNTFILKRFVDYIDVYPSLDIIESILKAVPVIPIDNHFIKSLEKITYATGCSSLGKSIISVTRKLGQSFGVNIDHLTNVKRNTEEEGTSSDSVLSYRAPIKLSDDRVVQTSEGESKLDQALNAKEGEDYLLAIALFREIIFDDEINKEMYMKCVKEISICYERLGKHGRSQRLNSFLRRKGI